MRSDPGKRLRIMMAELDINTNELADKTGLHPTTISNLRNGRVKKPQADTARLIAKALGVKVSFLWDDV